MYLGLHQFLSVLPLDLSFLELGMGLWLVGLLDRLGSGHSGPGLLIPGSGNKAQGTGFVIPGSGGSGFGGVAGIAYVGPLVRCL